MMQPPVRWLHFFNLKSSDLFLLFQELNYFSVLRLTRLERATCGFEVRRSIQLSYKRAGNWFPNEKVQRFCWTLGWKKGLEPSTTRSTIWRSAIELLPP